MAYTDPQSVTINSVATSMARVGSANPTTIGTFKTATGDYTLEVRQNQTAARFRREYRLTQKKVAADPISAVQKEVSASVILAVDEPKWGFSDTELTYLFSALNGALSASTNAKFTQLLGGEL